MTHQAFAELIETEPAFEVFRRIKAGELVPIARRTGRPMPCKPEHHECMAARLMPKDFHVLFDLEDARRILLAGKDLAAYLKDGPESRQGARLAKVFGCPLSEITLEMVVAKLEPLLHEWHGYEARQVAKYAEDPQREQWRYLRLPESDGEAELLCRYLLDAVFARAPAAEPVAGGTPETDTRLFWDRVELEMRRVRKADPALTKVQVATHPDVLSMWGRLDPPGTAYVLRKMSAMKLGFKKGRPRK